MDIQFALGAFLLTRSPITAVVGSAGVYADKPPQGKDPPFILYEHVGGTKHYHSRGASNLANALIQITCCAGTYVKCSDLFELVRNEIDGGQGAWAGVTIRGAFLSTPANVSVPSGQGSDKSHNGVRGTLEVNYFQSVPTLAGMS